MRELSMADTRETLKNHKAVEVGEWALARVWVLARVVASFIAQTILTT